MLSLFNSNFCFAFFASQTPALCSVIYTVPRKSVVRLCLIFLYSVIFVFACFASQTSGLCSAFPSAPEKSVTRFCYALVRTLFCVFCLTNTGFAQCYSLGSCTVCCTLVFNFALFSNFCFCVLCLTNIGFVQCFSFGSRKVSYTLLLRFSQNFVLRVLPHKHRLCAVLFPWLPYSLLHACV